MRELIRKELKNFVPYNENQVSYRVKLDANESPFDLPDNIKKKLGEYFLGTPSLNLYPDTDAVELKKVIGANLGVDFNSIVTGAGSSQIIQFIIGLFVEKGDRVVFPEPSFAMYRLNVVLGGGIPVGVTLKEENAFSYDIKEFIEKVRENNAKLLLLCSPNNPTGNLLSIKDIETIAQECKDCIIAIDEAYGEFSEESAVPLVAKYENMIVLRSFSKAYGLAGIRCGYSVSSLDMAEELRKVKPPYNLSSLAQIVAKFVLEDKTEGKSRIDYIIREREYLYNSLLNLGGIKVFPSKANFILIKVTDAEKICEELSNRGVLVRGFGNSPGLREFIRISIGKREENDIFLSELRKLLM